MTQNCKFQSVTLYISETVDHIIKIFWYADVRKWYLQVFFFILFLKKYNIGLKKLMLLLLEMWVMKRIFTQATVKSFFINLIEFFQQRLHFKQHVKLRKQHFSLLKNKEPYLLFFEGEKTSVHTNKFASGNFFVCTCTFLKQFSYTFNLSGQVVDKIIFTRLISGNNTTIFGPCKYWNSYLSFIALQQFL